MSNDDHEHTTFLPGIVRQHPNESINRLKSKAWSDVVILLGENAESILSNLLLDCGIFVCMSAGRDNYFQLSGIPLAELSATRNKNSPLQVSRKAKEHERPRDPSRIRFVRNRILYSRPGLNSARKVKVGLGHVHVLERCSDSTQPKHTKHVLQYMFPRQFGLHNVFTSTVDPAETSQPLKDYAFREMEIEEKSKGRPTKMPHRLRGTAIDMVRKMQRNHRNCSYSQLLRYYCPVTKVAMECAKNPEKAQYSLSTPDSEGLVTQMAKPSPTFDSSGSLRDQYDTETSFLPHSTSPEMISMFCRSVIKRLLPRNVLGTASDGAHNLRVILQRIDQFIKLRRFETLSLHQVMQEYESNRSIGWVVPRLVKDQTYPSRIS